MQQIGIIYQPKREEAVSYSQELGKLLQDKGVRVWLCSAWEPASAKAKLPGSDLVISIGGDGTILRAAKVVIPEPIPILGINFGNLGFMSEFTANGARNKLSSVLKGEGWIEERATLEAKLLGKTYYALNDMFIGRRSCARLVSVECKIKGAPLTTYRADGVIVATASGSTGYALAAGGPVLNPQSKEIVLIPVCSHFSLDKPLVLPSQTSIDLRVLTTHEAMLSLDGQVELKLRSGDQVNIKLSPHVVRFLRFQPKSYFYRTLEDKLSRKIK